ncbi:MAG: endonuclease domain-containing protein [Candidatus Gracilibacteria bacterium]
MNNLIKIQPRLPYNPKLKERATEMRKNMTKPEQIIRFNYLKNLNLRVLKQRPIGNFIVDFYIPSKMIVIEIDGDSHYTDNGLIYDEERSSILEGFGLKIIRFTNSEIIDNFEGVCVELSKKIN